MEVVPRLLLVIGLVFIAISLWMQFGPSIPWLGQLPGDLRIERPQGSFYFPLVSCLVVSVVISLLLTLFSRMR